MDAKRKKTDWDVASAQPTYSTNSQGWDVPIADVAGADSDGEKFEAWELLLQELLEPYVAGNMTAKKFCKICYFAAEAGVQELRKYSLPPTSSTGHYQRKLDTVLEFKLDDARTDEHRR